MTSYFSRQNLSSMLPSAQLFGVLEPILGIVRLDKDEANENFA